MIQDKKIKLNISYISYIVFGLLAFILLFAAFTSTAHAQASTTPGVVSALTQITVDDETFQVKPLILDEITNFTIRGLGSDESSVIFRFMPIDAAGEFTDAEAIVRQVTKTQMKEINGVWVWSPNLNFLEEGVHKVVLEIKSDITISYINVSAPPEAVSVEKLVSEVEKRGFFGQVWDVLVGAWGWFKSLFEAPPSCEELKLDFENVKIDLGNLSATSSKQDVAKVLNRLKDILDQLQESDCNCKGIVVASSLGATITIDDFQTIIESFLENPPEDVGDLNLSGVSSMIDVIINCLEGQITPPPPSEDCDCYRKALGDEKGTHIKNKKGEIVLAPAGTTGDWVKLDDCSEVPTDARDAAGNIIDDNYVEICPEELLACENQAYVANKEGQYIAIIDTDTNQVVATLPVEDHPLGVAADPVALKVYVTGYTNNKLFVIEADPTSSDFNTIVHTIDTVGLFRPYGVAVDPKTSTIVVANNGDASVSIIEYDPDALKVDIFTIVPVGKEPIGVSIDSTTSTAYVANSGDNTVSVIDVDKNSSTYNTVISTIFTKGIVPYGFGIMVDEAKNLAYVTNNAGDDVSVIDLSNNQVVTKSTPPVPVPVEKEPIGVAIYSSINRAYIANNNDDSISVINTINNIVIAMINQDKGSGPFGLAVDRLHNQLYVTNSLNSTVSVVDTTSNIEIIVIPMPPIAAALTAFPAGVAVLDCALTEEETVPPSGCSGGQILVGDQCVCPKGTVFDTTIERCIRLTLPPIGIPIDISGGGVIPIGGDTGGGIIPCPLDDPDC